MLAPCTLGDTTYSTLYPQGHCAGTLYSWGHCAYRTLYPCGLHARTLGDTVLAGTPCWHPAPSGTLRQHPWGHCVCTLRDPAPVPVQDSAPTGTSASTLCLWGPHSSTHRDPLPAPYVCGEPVPPAMGSPCQHLASSGTLYQHPEHLACWRPYRTPSQPHTHGCRVGSHLGEVAGQPVAVTGPRGGPQGQVEGAQLAGSHGLRGDVELVGSAVPQGHPAAGELEGARGVRW